MLPPVSVDQTEQLPEEALLDALRSLPEASPFQSVLWVPRRSRQAAAAVLRELLASATLHAEAENGRCAAETAHRLLRAAPQILFRLPPGDLAEMQNKSSGTAVRQRLHRAARGLWKELVEECLQDVAAISVAVMAGSPTRCAARRPEDIPDAALQAAALKSRHGSDKAACQILVGGPPVPPGQETDAKIKKLFRTEQLSELEQQELEEALRAAGRTKRRMRCTPQHASRCVSRLRLAAGSGPSGWRNSYIALVHSHPDGAKTLAEWAAIWSQARLAPWLADLWTSALVRPFFKSNAVDVRPILCAEALLKLAVGAAIRGADRELAAAMGSTQFGAGRRGGAELEVGQARAAAGLQPQHGLASLDIQNAFGSVQWRDALKVVTAAVPKLGPLLALQWGACRLRLWLQNSNGVGWHVLFIYGSLLQGGLDGHPVFCLVISVIIHRVSQNPAIKARWNTIKCWIYVDDMLFQAPLDSLPVLMEVLGRTLEAFSMKLQTQKSRLHIPELAGIPADEWPAHAQHLGDLLPLSPEGLTILGTEAAGEYALPLGPWAAAAAETRSRANRACKLAEAAKQLVKRPPPAGGKQVAFRIVRNIVTHALDYDARVLSSGLVLPHARQVESHCWDVIEQVVGQQLTPLQRKQVELPTRLGGLQTMPTSLAPLARAAGLMESGPEIRAAIGGWGYGVETACAADGVDDAVTDGIMDALREQGISVGPSGVPLAQPLADTQQADALRPPVPHQHLLSQLLRTAAQQSYDGLFEVLGPRGRTRILSAGGPTAGKCLTAVAGLTQAHFTDITFSQVLKWRLGCENHGVAQGCCNTKATGEACEETLDDDHAVTCEWGPLRTQRHDNLADQLAECTAETGAHVRREAWIAELATPSAEAILDIWAFGAADVQDCLVDVTVRHPMAERYQPAASMHAGAAASAAANEKRERYPSRGGRQVTPFAVETWGRLDVAAEALLEDMAAAAARHDALRGRAPSQTGCLKRWRAAIDAVVQRGVAMSLLAARYGLPGRPARRSCAA